MRKLIHSVAAVVIGIGASVALTSPATAITGGVEDLGNTYSNVGMVVFYQPDGRFRCSGTLIAPQGVPNSCTLHVPGHRTRSSSRSTPSSPAPRRSPKSTSLAPPTTAGPTTRYPKIGFTAADITAPDYAGEQTLVPRHAGDASAIQRFHRSQELERHRRHHPRRGARASDDAAALRRTTSTSSPSRSSTARSS